MSQSSWALGRFLKGGSVYAVGVFLYSGLRQAIFFPLLHKIDSKLFIDVSYFLLICDLLVFPIAGSLGDFYQKRHAIKDKEGIRNKVFGVFVGVSFLYIPVFLFLNFGLGYAICGALFVAVYAKNSLVQRLIYNRLDFGESIKYNIFRSLPFVFALVPFYLGGGITGEVIALLVLSFEVAYYFLFLRGEECVRALSRSEVRAGVSSFWRGGGLALVFATICGAYLHRGEMVVAGMAWKSDYPLVVMVCTLLSIFVTPISLIFSTPLMSFLVAGRVALNRAGRFKVAASVLSFSFVVSLFGYFAFPYVLTFMYGAELKGGWDVFVSISLFSVSAFFLSRTFVSRYCAPKVIALSNVVIFLGTLPMLYFNQYLSFVQFWMVFSVFRALIPIAFFVIDKSSERL